MPDPSPSSGQLDFRDYLSVLRRRKVVIIATTATVVLLAVVLSVLQTPTYEATAEVLLGQRASSQVLNPEDRSTALDIQQSVQTELEVMQSRSVRTAVVEELGYEPDITVAARGATSVVAVTAHDTDQDQVAAEANAFARTYLEVRRTADVADLQDAATVLQGQIDEIDTQIQSLEEPLASFDARIAAAPDDASRAAAQAEREGAERTMNERRSALAPQRIEYSSQLGEIQIAVNTTQTGGAGEVISEARTPGSPASPKPVRNAVVALVFGLMLGVGAAFARDYLDDSIKTKDELDRVTGGIDVLGLVPRVAAWKDRDAAQLVSATDPRSPAAEAYRSLRTSLGFLGITRPMRIIQVTSASASEGKTTTLANLGVSLAGAGNRVVLVDSDLRRPRLHDFFGLDSSEGLTTALLGDRPLEEVVQPVPGHSRLTVLPSGAIPPNPSELLATPQAQSLFASLAEMADYVLVDCPPLLPVTDALTIAGNVDATIVVANVNTTTQRALRRALELLQQVDAPLVGVVLNGLGAEAAYSYTYGRRSHDGSRKTIRIRLPRLRRRRPRGRSEVPSSDEPHPAVGAEPHAPSDQESMTASS